MRRRSSRGRLAAVGEDALSHGIARQWGSHPPGGVRGVCRQTAAAGSPADATSFSLFACSQVSSEAGLAGGRRLRDRRPAPHVRLATATAAPGVNAALMVARMQSCCRACLGGQAAAWPLTLKPLTQLYVRHRGAL
jgi:hypothetical protein